ncbi:hypothetical protein [Vogesella indigofera]|uniref:hypothetical protein n=1 Tax=Vogesella indigofera TaxID=45465 RepID=UPI00234D8546|nr:hypothetical protein [Vogesella indigofera]MDC7704601.1 hypothetical protein [Vogesella indigofera]
MADQLTIISLVGGSSVNAVDHGDVIVWLLSVISSRWSALPYRVWSAGSEKYTGRP